MTAEQAWQELLDKDDRTSPEEYPEMCLITLDELRGFMARQSCGNGPDPLRKNPVVGWMSEKQAEEILKDMQNERRRGNA